MMFSHKGERCFHAALDFTKPKFANIFYVCCNSEYIIQIYFTLIFNLRIYINIIGLTVKQTIILEKCIIVLPDCQDKSTLILRFYFN